MEAGDGCRVEGDGYREDRDGCRVEGDAKEQVCCIVKKNNIKNSLLKGCIGMAHDLKQYQKYKHYS